MRPCTAALSLALFSSLPGCSDSAENPGSPVQVKMEVQPVKEPVEEELSVEDRLAALELRIDLLEQGKTLAGEYAAAKVLLGRMAAEYPKTESYRRSQRIESELSLFDSPVPTESESHIQEWFTTQQAMAEDGNLGWSSGTSLVIFWERWCPGCRNEMPELQQIHDDWEGKGLKLMALTRVTRNETRDGVAFSFPIAKEDGQLASFFKVQALPAAAVIQDGVVIWRGDPKRITDKELRSWVGE
jgi:thiol-disulfide isomerase/thioredoxin